MTSGLHVFSAGDIPPVQEFYSGEVDFLTLSWVNRLSAEKISANAGVPLYNWYFPVGITGFLSGTAAGSSAMWVKLSATAPANYTGVFRCSARITTDSAKNLIEWFDVKIHTGVA